MKLEISILAADFSKLGSEVKEAEKSGADLIHIDVMDGHFVPNLGIGSFIVKDIRNKTKIPFNIHLMVEEPDRWIPRFVEAGGDTITVHAETRYGLYTTIQMIKKLDRKVGIAFNPLTPLNIVEHTFEDVDLILLMSVDPGFSGQTFIPGILTKIKKARKIIDNKGLKIDLAVDGGINEKIAPLVYKAGANNLVVGAGIFHNINIKKAIEVLKRVDIS